MIDNNKKFLLPAMIALIAALLGGAVNYAWVTKPFVKDLQEHKENDITLVIEERVENILLQIIRLREEFIEFRDPSKRFTKEQGERLLQDAEDIRERLSLLEDLTKEQGKRLIQDVEDIRERLRILEAHILKK
jgi:flagellar motility protein MotE (MotC chaperone)